MPTYDYQCNSCNKLIEIFHKISDPAITECPFCHKNTLQRKPGGGIGLAFKGTGWYKTDYNSAPPSSPETPKGTSDNKCCPCGKDTGSCSSS